MENYVLIILIAATWISYLIAGLVAIRARAARDGLRTTRSFTYLPEVIIYPPAFLGFAKIIDFFLQGWGTLIVGGVCVYMLAWFLAIPVRDLNELKRFRKGR